MFIKIFSNCYNIQTSKIELPIVDIQPIISIPNYISSYNDDELIIGVTDFTGIENSKYLSIDFSINYLISRINSIENIENNFDLINTKVSLYRFKKINKKSQVYIDKFNKPINVPITIISNEIDFKLYISNKLSDKNIGKLKKGCQFISIKSKSQLNNKEDLMKSIKNFIKLFGKSNRFNINNFAFYFKIELQLKNILKGTQIIKIYTKMFKIILKSNGCNLTTELVNKDDYFLFQKLSIFK